jgi:hypothetical protein
MRFGLAEPWEIGDLILLTKSSGGGRREMLRLLGLGLASTRGQGCSGAPPVQAWVGEASRGADGSSCADGGAWPAVECLGNGGGFAKGRWLDFVLGGESPVGSIYRGRLRRDMQELLS